MAQNVIVSIFEVESEAYQAITELKRDYGNEKSFLAEAILVKKENGALRVLDSFDTGANSSDDMLTGGLIGGLFGILGGPVGVLLGGAYGALLGATLDSIDILGDMSVIERIAEKTDEGDLAIIGLANEEDETILDEKLGKFKVIIARFDAAVVAAEVEEAQIMEAEMAREAREKLRGEKMAAYKEKVEEKRAKIAADFDSFKAKFRNG